MTDSTINLIWVILFRTAQTALETAPTLLCGLFVAGLMRGMIGPQALRTWFTSDNRTGPVRAWFTGLLLPVCSFGILPIAWELKRAGVPRGSVLTLLLSAPLINPFSLVYAVQRLEGTGPSGLVAIAFLLMGSFAITVGLGILLGRFLPEPTTLPELPPVPSSAPRRLGVVILTAGRALVGDLLPYLLIGAFGSGLLAIIPGGALERAINDRSVSSPVHVAWVSIPFQTTPTHGMVLVCESLISGASVGRVFVFFLFGIGLHLGTFAWIAWTYGYRLFLYVVPAVIACGLAIGFVVPFAIPAQTQDSATDCHFLEIESSGGYKVAKARTIRTTLTDDAGELQWFNVGACGMIVGLWLIGLVSMSLGERGSLTQIMAGDQVTLAEAQPTVWSATINRRQQTMAAAAVVLIVVLAGLYIYYPAPRELFNQMDIVQTELTHALKVEPIPRRRALHLTGQWKRLQNKLIVTDVLRRGRIDASVRKSSTALSTAIDRVRAAITSGSSPSELKPMLIEAQQATEECREIVEQNRQKTIAPVRTTP